MFGIWISWLSKGAYNYVVLIQFPFQIDLQACRNDWDIYLTCQFNNIYNVRVEKEKLVRVRKVDLNLDFKRRVEIF